MKISGRFNSFLFKGTYDVLQVIDLYKQIDGITHLEFNYPEHISPFPIGELKAHMGHLKVNGVATRFRNFFVDGEFTNPDAEKRKAALCLCKEAIDACKALGGTVVTVWLGFDGFDYIFQADYEQAWDTIIRSFREIADYAAEKDLRISIEYKPFDPRSFSFIDSIGLTLLAINEIGRENVGTTVDICHVMMKHESPAFSFALAASRGRLFGLHLNDGYNVMDSGLVFGSVNYIQALELVYYLKKYKYDGTIFFDTFPVREDAVRELQMNIKMFRFVSDTIDEIGLERISKVCSLHDGISSQELVYEMLAHKNNFKEKEK
jgi:xylose isomerase